MNFQSYFSLLTFANTNKKTERRKGERKRDEEERREREG
jgi:hypothetical protein